MRLAGIFLLFLCLLLPGTCLADEYDGILLTRGEDIAIERYVHACAFYSQLPCDAGQLIGTWAAPDGGTWVFEQSGIMGNSGRHMGCSFSAAGDILTWSGSTGTESYQMHFYAGYSQLYLTDIQSGKCVLALQKITQFLQGTTDLSTSGTGLPLGSLDMVGVGSGVVFVGGWLFDQDIPAEHLQFWIVVGDPSLDGEMSDAMPADLVRADVAAVYGIDKYHGMGGTFYTQKEGEQDIYVYTKDYPSGNMIQVGHCHAYLPPVPVSDAVQSGGQSQDGFVPAENRYTPEEAASIMHWYCNSRASEGTTSYISDEYQEDEHTYVVWWRSYTSFTVQYRIDLITGDVTECGPYNGKTPDEQLPFSETYAFNLDEYDEHADYDESDMQSDYFPDQTDDYAEYLPQTDPNVRNSILNGQIMLLGNGFEIDLDGDGEPEQIELECDDYYYGPYWLWVDAEYQEGYGENIRSSVYGFSLDGQHIELIVYQEGPSDDPVCDVYHYNGEELIFAGSMEDTVEHIQVTENRTISGCVRCNIMDTSYIDVEWAQDVDGTIYQIWQDVYHMTNPVEQYGNTGPFYATLKTTLLVYDSMDTDSDVHELQPQRVHFPYTDTYEWVYVETEDLDGGWLNVYGWDYEDRGWYFGDLRYAD